MEILLNIEYGNMRLWNYVVLILEEQFNWQGKAENDNIKIPNPKNPW